MGSRKVAVDRLFNLGDYKNVRFSEEVEVDEDVSDEFMDVLRYGLILNAYMGFALHHKLLKEVNAAGWDPDEIMTIVLRERGLLEEEGLVLKVQLVEEDE